MEVKMTAQVQWNELNHHHCLIHFSLFLLWLSLSLKMTALMTISWEPLQSNLKQYIITVGLKAPSLQSNSSCMSSGSSNRMIALQAPPASFASLPTASQNNSFGLHRIWGPAVSEELLHFSKDKELAVSAAKTSSERHRMDTSRVCREQLEGTAQAPCTMKNPVLEPSALMGRLLSPSLCWGGCQVPEALPDIHNCSGQHQDPNILLYVHLNLWFTNNANYTMCLIPELGSSSVCATQSIRKQQPLATVIRLQLPAVIWSSSLDYFLCGHGRSMSYWRCVLKWCW